MNILTLILSLALSLNSFAATEGLSDLISGHEYFLTVEWDQQDASVLSAKNAEFQKKLSLIPGEELEQYVRANLRPEEIEMMKIRLGSGEDQMTLLRELTRENKGASWNAAGTAVLVAGGIALSLFVAYTWFIHNQLECDGFYDCHGGE